MVHHRHPRSRWLQERGHWHLDRCQGSAPAICEGQQRTILMTIEELTTALANLDEGLLRYGNHTPGVMMCALEFESVVRGREWSDRPLTLPDLRPLNDGPWSSDKARTSGLLPVMVSLWDWSSWSEERIQQWTDRDDQSHSETMTGSNPDVRAL